MRQHADASKCCDHFLCESLIENSDTKGYLLQERKEQRSVDFFVLMEPMHL